VKSFHFKKGDEELLMPYYLGILEIQQGMNEFVVTDIVSNSKRLSVVKISPVFQMKPGNWDLYAESNKLVVKHRDNQQVDWNQHYIFHVVKHNTLVLSSLCQNIAYCTFTPTAFPQIERDGSVIKFRANLLERKSIYSQISILNEDESVFGLMIDFK
jgi:hypothetical protein